MSKILEADFKKLTLNYLRNKGVIKADTIILSELTVDNFSRRVDLAILDKDTFIALEIKSEGDSLRRLNGQLDKYLELFDKVIVVAHKKFKDKLLASTPKNVALWIVEDDVIKVTRRGVKKRFSKTTAHLSFIDQKEIRKLKIDKSLDPNKSSNEDLLKKIKSSELRSLIKNSLSKKFLKSSNEFKKITKERKIEKTDIEALSRYKKERDFKKSQLKKSQTFWDNIENYTKKLNKKIKD